MISFIHSLPHFFLSLSPTVYPTLDHSDDEDFPIFKPRGKKKEDEAWNPKARVRVWGPRPERPARVGVKKQAVEKGLEVAASRRNALPVSWKGV